MSITKDPPSETSRLLDNDAIIETAAVDVFESAITDVNDPNDNEDIRWLREERLNHQTKAWYNRPTVFLLSVALLLNFTTMGVSISAKVMLIMRLICRDYYSHHTETSFVDDLECRVNPSVQGELSSLTSFITLLSGACSCLISGKMGELSDRFGRRPVLAFAGLTGLLGRAIIACLLMDGRLYHKNWLIFGYIVESIAGGNPVIVSVASSYITDIVEPHERIVSLGFMVGTLYGGLAIGPIFGNIIIKTFGGHDIYALYAELILNALFVLMILFVIKESRPMKLRRKSQSSHLRRKASFVSVQSNNSTSAQAYNQLQLWRIVDIFAPLKKLWLPKHPTQGFKPRYNILILLFGENVLTLAGAAMTNALVLYATYTFKWGTDDIGYYVSTIGFCKAFCLYGVSPVLLHFLKKIFTIKKKSIDFMDLFVILIALTFDSLGPLTIIFATNGSQIYASAIFASLGALGSPSIQSSIVKYVPETQTGEIFGAMALIKNLLLCLGPPTFLQIYSRSVGVFPTLVFWITFSLLVAAAALVPFLKGHEEEAGEEESVITSIVDADLEEADNLINQSVFRSPRKSIDSPRR